MVRIRYIKSAFTNTLVASKSVLCGNKVVFININTDNLIYDISTTSETLAKGQGKSLNDTKKLVKRDLKLLGANFNSEIRNKGKTRKL